MQIEPMKGLEDVLLIRPDLHEDDRGYFYEVFNEKEFNEKTNNKYNFHVLQENESKSTVGVFRGLHFQRPPYEQAKLVRVLEGRVIDFAVDIRKGSPTFGKCVFAELTGENKCQFFIPRGFAHGFWVKSLDAVFEYKCDNYYNKESEGGIRWDDENISIILPPQEETKIFSFDTPYSYTPKTYSEDLEGASIYSFIMSESMPKLSEKDKNRITTLKDL